MISSRHTLRRHGGWLGWLAALSCLALSGFAQEPRQLSLAEARRVAFARNWDLLAAKVDVEAALAQKIIAKEFPNPTLSLSTAKISFDDHPNATTAGNSIWNRSFDNTLAISQLFEIGGKRTARRDSALAGVAGAEARLRDARRVLVVTESVFSMDGDLAPLAAIADLAEAHGAWLMVDEAHAAGVFGPAGAGLVAALGLTDRVHVHMGTLGKAIGSFGAYVAGSRALVDHLVNRARSFIFTTGLPPSAAAAASVALDVIAREPERAAGLLQRARALGETLRGLGLEVPNLQSQVLPVMVGDARRAVQAATELMERGFYVAAIRPPTVPQGTSRLRLSLMATHDAEAIEGVATALAAVLAPRSNNR